MVEEKIAGADRNVKKSFLGISLLSIVRRVQFTKDLNLDSVVGSVLDGQDNIAPGKRNARHRDGHSREGLIDLVPEEIFIVMSRANYSGKARKVEPIGFFRPIGGSGKHIGQVELIKSNYFSWHSSILSYRWRSV